MTANQQPRRRQPIARQSSIFVRWSAFPGLVHQLSGLRPVRVEEQEIERKGSEEKLVETLYGVTIYSQEQIDQLPSDVPEGVRREAQRLFDLYQEERKAVVARKWHDVVVLLERDGFHLEVVNQQPFRVEANVTHGEGSNMLVLDRTVVNSATSVTTKVDECRRLLHGFLQEESLLPRSDKERERRLRVTDMYFRHLMEKNFYTVEMVDGYGPYTYAITFDGTIRMGMVVIHSEMDVDAVFRQLDDECLEARSYLATMGMKLRKRLESMKVDFTDHNREVPQFTVLLPGHAPITLVVEPDCEDVTIDQFEEYLIGVYLTQ